MGKIAAAKKAPKASMEKGNAKDLTEMFLTVQKKEFSLILLVLATFSFCSLQLENKSKYRRNQGQ